MSQLARRTRMSSHLISCFLSVGARRPSDLAKGSLKLYQLEEWITVISVSLDPTLRLRKRMVKAPEDIPQSGMPMFTNKTRSGCIRAGNLAITLEMSEY